MYLIISYNNSLFGWLFCDVGCLSCVLMRYIELRLLVSMYVGFMFVLISFIVSCMAVSPTLSMFCSPGSLYANLMFFLILYMM
jgi:hypothetical protein